MLCMFISMNEYVHVDCPMKLSMNFKAPAWSNLLPKWRFQWLHNEPEFIPEIMCPTINDGMGNAAWSLRNGVSIHMTSGVIGKTIQADLRSVVCLSRLSTKPSWKPVELRTGAPNEEATCQMTGHLGAYSLYAVSCKRRAFSSFDYRRAITFDIVKYVHSRLKANIRKYPKNIISEMLCTKYAKSYRGK